jgi:hypothetical protein
MELWIRSQDKTELVKVNNLANIDYRIVFINNGNGRTTLGTYATKERALEVLDEIEDFIYTEIDIKNALYEHADIEVKSKILCNMTKIFEMPKE